MATKTKKTKTEKEPAYKVELVEKTTKGEKRKSKYEGDNYDEYYECLHNLRSENHPQIEVVIAKEKIRHIYTKKPGQQNYRLAFQKLTSKTK